ncbi:MAG: hypothetical protein ACE365_04860 [Gammaproteobacteria bacterium]
MPTSLVAHDLLDVHSPGDLIASPNRDIEGTVQLDVTTWTKFDAAHFLIQYSLPSASQTAASAIDVSPRPLDCVRRCKSCL